MREKKNEREEVMIWMFWNLERVRVLSNLYLILFVLIISIFVFYINEKF